MGRGFSVPQLFGTSYMRAHSMRNDNQILHGDQTRCENNFIYNFIRSKKPQHDTN